MGIVEVFVFIAAFVALYGGMVVIGWAIDKLLRYYWNIGIFPKDYFK